METVIDSSSTNRGKSQHTHHLLIDAGTTQFSPSRSPARYVQLVTELYIELVQTTIFNKLEVSRLDSTLSSFVIISLYNTYFIMMSDSGKIF